MATSRPGRRAALPQPAYVLQRHDWSESSLIVELFTRGLGRVVTVARGAKKPTSNYRALLLPFQPVQVLLGQPPRQADEEQDHDILPLRQAEWAGGQPLVRGAALLSAFYLNELLLKGLARQDPHPALFDAYTEALAALAVLTQASAGAVRPGASEEAEVLRAFELLLLRETGLLPDLAQATLTAEWLDPACHYALDTTAGLVQASAGPLGAQWQALEQALGLADASARFDALRAACHGLAGLLRKPLQGLLHYHLGHTPMRTREVGQGVRRLLPS
jgi:DNA repair protein RecO (recombination protein O)